MAALGRALIAFALLATIASFPIADWNETHVFNPTWPPHARFHAVLVVCLTVGFSALGLWLLWRRSRDRTALAVAALVPILAWGSFFVAALVPGAAAEDHPGQLPRVIGMPLNLFLAAVFCALASLGLALAAGRSKGPDEPLNATRP